MFLSTTPTQFFNTSWDNDSHHHGDVAHVTHPTFCDTRKSCKSRGWHCLKPTAYTAPSHWVSLLEVKVDNPKQYLLSWKAWLSWCLLTTYLTTHSPYFDLTSVVSCSNRWTCSVISSPEEPPTKQGEVRHSEGPCVAEVLGLPTGMWKCWGLQPYGAQTAALASETPRFLPKGSSSTHEQCFEEQSEFPPQGGTIKLSETQSPSQEQLCSSLPRSLLGMFLHQKEMVLRGAVSLKNKKIAARLAPELYTWGMLSASLWAPSSTAALRTLSSWMCAALHNSCTQQHEWKTCTKEEWNLEAHLSHSHF